jgi:ABC-type phosphate/phosphonate transport system substrate-binding protein
MCRPTCARAARLCRLAQREEDTKFQSVFIAKTDSGIKTLADMKGKQISALAPKAARRAT